MIHQELLSISTTGRGCVELTGALQDVVAKQAIAQGLCHVLLQHTSAALMLCENADPTVRQDLETFMTDLVPDGDRRFRHTQEGPDDMPAHVRSVLCGVELTLPIRDQQLALGTWQGVYLWEQRLRGHRRKLMVTLMG